MPNAISVVTVPAPPIGRENVNYKNITRPVDLISVIKAFVMGAGQKKHAIG